MAKGSIRVDGLRQLGEAMRVLRADMNSKIVRAATNAAAQVVKKSAVDKAPIGTQPHKVSGVFVQPGNLKKNIVVRRILPGKTVLTSEHHVTVRSPKRLGPKQKASGNVGAFYWRFIEFGTVKLSPRPFLRPAFDQNIPKCIEVMKSVLKKRIDRASR